MNLMNDMKDATEVYIPIHYVVDPSISSLNKTHLKN